MPGKHAPASPWSFYASLMRAGFVGAVGLGLIVAIVAVTLGARDTGNAGARSPGDLVVSPSPSPTAVTEPTPTEEPTQVAEPSGSPSISPSPIEPGPPGATAGISVLNGTTRNGLAARIRAKLVDEGYTRVVASNADATDTTKIYYRGRSREAAEYIANLIPELGTPEPATDDTPKGAVVIILGSDFHG